MSTYFLVLTFGKMTWVEEVEIIRTDGWIDTGSINFNQLIGLDWIGLVGWLVFWREDICKGSL
jgi:hypothetical protein